MSNEKKLTHLNADGEAHMVDISGKEVTHRSATAAASFYLQAKTINILLDKKSPKGDVFAAARLAGIMGAKKTSDLIPLCHPLPLTKVSIDFETKADSEDKPHILVTCTAKTTGKTGVEMEALTGVSVACLTLYDMLKAVDKSMSVSAMRLMEKTGGKSGNWSAEQK